MDKKKSKEFYDAIKIKDTEIHEGNSRNKLQTASGLVVKLN